MPQDPQAPGLDAEVVQAKLAQIAAWQHDPQADPQILELLIRGLGAPFRGASPR